jgi:hypothetical protein
MSISSPEPIAGLASASAAAEYNEGFTFTLIKFIIITAIFVGITVAMFSASNITEITKNFPKYRCNPAMMPFAASFGYDPKENFNFCINSIFNVKAAEVFSPIYRLLGQFTQTITVIVNATLGIRTLFSNFFLSINKFIGNVRNKIQELLFRIRIQFMKMMNLMGKVYGTMFGVIFMGTSALTAANNLANNDLVNFLMGFCFDPETPVWMADGSAKPIKEIQIGDLLKGRNGPVKATSLFLFDGTNVPMVRIGSVLVSSNHYVEFDGEKIPASSHPSALPTDSLPHIYCLNVEENEFYVGDEQLNVADYDEHEAPGVIDAVQKTAESALNGTVAESGVADYSLGFDPLLEVQLTTGAWKMAANLQIGDNIAGAGRVLGLVRESCEEVFVSPTGARFSGAQLVWSDASKKWERAAFIWADRKALPANLVQILTARCSSIPVRDMLGSVYYVRDYREVPLEEMETPYENAFAQ